jgi:O-antigen/teichoic acid export membrane protein
MGTEEQVVWRVDSVASQGSAVHNAAQSDGWQTAWAFADQAVVSLGNFVTNIILARKLAPHDYGRYAILLGVVLLVYGVHNAIVIYPLSLRGAAASENNLRSLTALSLWLTASTGVVFGAALVIACLALGKVGLGLCGAAAMILLVIQETLRRALMAHMRFRDSFIGDSLSYLGQVGVVLLLAVSGRLSVEAAFLAMALTSLAAAGLQMTQLGVSQPPVHRASAMLLDFWRLGRWALLNNAVAIFSVQFFPWMLAVLLGAAAAGTFQALNNVLGVANPIVFSAVNVILPASAKAWRASGLQAASRIAFHYGGLAGLILCPCFAATLLLPGRVLALFYGHESSYLAYVTALRILVAATAVNYIAVVFSTLVNAIEKTRVTFIVLVASGVSSFLVGLPLIAWKGLAGAATAMMMGAVIRAAMLSVQIRRFEFNVAEIRIR